MRSHGRRGAVCVLALMVFSAGLAGLWAGQAERPCVLPEMLRDAELTDVWFVDSDQGWAVGDRGVILHTEDGGRQWQLQRVPETCRLESVHFLDSQVGWVVGGRVHPYTHQTSCVVLRTQDGGRTWSLVPGLTLPALKHVQFLTLKRGWAVGQSSALYPAGLFCTEDGGLSWSTLPAAVPGRWTGADFRDFERGLVVGLNAQLARVGVPDLAAVPVEGLQGRPLRAVRMLDDVHGWLVGDGGLVLGTADGGVTWRVPPGALPEGVEALFDFRALAAWGDHLWVAGAPGSGVFHSGDGGRTWELQRTGQHLPLRAMTFVDAQRGWAVGALGTILGTRDGGASWRPLRSGGERAALLGIYSEASRIPMELFAWASGQEGYLSAVEILNRRDLECPPRVDASAEDASRGAISAVGGCAVDHAWQFPLRQEGLQLGPDKLIGLWDQWQAGHSIQRLEELVVRRIRQWRPDVIVTEAASPRGDNPLSHIVNQIVLSAARSAADSGAYPDQLSIAGLQPWSVKKVFSTVAEDDQPTVTLTTTQLIPRVGCSLADQAQEGYGLVRLNYQPLPTTVGFRLLVDRLPQAAGRRDIFSGIYTPAGGDARRALSAGGLQDLEALTRAAQKRRNIEQIFLATTGPAAQPAGWLAQVQDLTKSLSAASAGQLLYQLAQRYLAAGQVELAAQSLEQLVSRYPDHALSDTALTWLIQHYASGEIGWQLRRQTQATTQIAVGEPPRASPSGGVQPAGLLQPVPGPVLAGAEGAGFVPFNAQAVPGPASMAVDRAARAVEFATWVQRGRPALFAEPSLQFPTAAAYRTKGLPRDAERFYHRLGAGSAATDWGRCAQAELWFAHGRGPSPKPVYRCVRAVSPPELDGRLEDAMWERAERLELSSDQHDDATWPATMMLAYDDEFFYLAASCRKAPGAQYPTSSGPRPRDPPLDDRDRIDLLIDLDRDYTTYYRLTFDYRGWTGEACVGDTHWDPVWYVACDADAEQWVVEAAIPLVELVDAPPQRRDVWAVGAQRIVPRVGIQSFTKPASVIPRGEGFALMVFE